MSGGLMHYPQNHKIATLLNNIKDEHVKASPTNGITFCIFANFTNSHNFEVGHKTFHFVDKLILYLSGWFCYQELVLAAVNNLQ
jgi:hypothetical protein